MITVLMWHAWRYLFVLPEEQLHWLGQEFFLQRELALERQIGQKFTLCLTYELNVYQERSTQ